MVARFASVQQVAVSVVAALVATLVLANAAVTFVPVA